MIKTSPFKLLEAYGKEDKEIFFGREKETEALYKMSFQTNLMLIYGMSGTGKTSLIRCGLANRIEETDWFDVYIRRKDNINHAIIDELIAHDKALSFEDDYGVCDMVKSLYLDFLKPVYLIFDQFEELFILGSEEEYLEFVHTIKELLDAELPCKILIVMREEYLAHLSTFEKIVPTLFDKRLRVEPMTLSNAKKVIINTAQNPQFGIHLADETVADRILENITEGKNRIQLTYLQVFLDKMYQLAFKRNKNRIIFDEGLVKQVGRIEDVLVVFLEEQVALFGSQVGPTHLAWKFLKIFASDKGTKIPTQREEFRKQMPELEEEELLKILNFFLANRILRPLDNEQYELTHDSIAYKLFKTTTVGISIPNLIPGFGKVPSNPFLRFRPFPREMASVFYGRETEVKELFEMIVNKTQIRTTLVFGPLGVGKTSLLQAGLIPRLEQIMKVAMLPINREFLESALCQQMLNSNFQEGEEPLLFKAAFQWHRNKPDRLERKTIILDQFEELFIWITDHDQLVSFYKHLNGFVNGNWNVDVVLVIRDEFFAQLQDLEYYLPGVLDEQIRIKHLDYNAAKRIVRNLSEKADLEIEQEEVIDRIVKSAEENDGRVNLTYLQLYMDKLYRGVNTISEGRNESGKSYKKN